MPQNTFIYSKTSNMNLKRAFLNLKNRAKITKIKTKKRKKRKCHAQNLHDLSCNTAWSSGHGCGQSI
jgi:hypothetical protein